MNNKMANYLGLAVKEMGIIYHINPKEVIYFGCSWLIPLNQQFYFLFSSIHMDSSNVVIAKLVSFFISLNSMGP